MITTLKHTITLKTKVAYVMILRKMIFIKIFVLTCQSFDLLVMTFGDSLQKLKTIFRRDGAIFRFLSVMAVVPMNARK